MNVTDKPIVKCFILVRCSNMEIPVRVLFGHITELFCLSDEVGAQFGLDQVQVKI